MGVWGGGTSEKERDWDWKASATPVETGHDNMRLLSSPNGRLSGLDTTCRSPITLAKVQFALDLLLGTWSHDRSQ